ncbi:MAG: GrpB family protein [Aureispira sp.]|nr:GrpB family protein [Aureispira sp.]
MLGLKRHTVQLVSHHPLWKDYFAETKSALMEWIGAYVLDIQHVGSTAILDIQAKPIMDIAIAVADLGVLKFIIVPLEQHGYEYRGDSGKDGGHLFVKCSSPDIRTEHIHIVHINDEQWTNYLNFRNSLNDKKELAQQYSQLKKELEQKYFDNRRAYTKAKNDFIHKVLESLK